MERRIVRTRNVDAVQTSSLVLVLFLMIGVAPGTIAAEARDPNGVAVIIGNRNYEKDRVPEVAFAHRDADAFKHYVLEVLGYDPANVIDLRDASQAEIMATFGNRETHKGKIWRYLDPEEGSDVVVFYSGHGVPGQKDRRGYLLPADADPDAVEINGYPIDLLYQNLGKLEEAREVRVFLDACFSGDSHQGMLIRAASPVAMSVAPPVGAEGLTILTAASDTQLASWDEEAGHGLFTHHLLDALYGKGDTDDDGKVTAREVKRYLDRHLTRAARRTYGREQQASLVGEGGAVLTVAATDGGFPARPILDQVSKGTAKAEAEKYERSGCEGCPEMVVVPAGSFLMGSPRSEAKRGSDEGPLHRVALARSVAVGKYEVTFDEWDTCVREGGCGGYRPDDEGWGRGRRPVINVNWNDAKAYVKWLSEKTGEAYRLLSESEWEYAARAGTTTPFHTGETISTEKANYNGKYTYGPGHKGKYLQKTTPVGSFSPNDFGLHDVHGNVWEWIEGCWNENYKDAPQDGSAWESGNCRERMLRGGSWNYPPEYLRSANRYEDAAGNRSNDYGFRVARTFDP